MNKILRKIYNFFYSLPFAMKGGELLTGQAKADGSEIGVIREVESQRLGENLLKGEVTQEVEELRYRTYKVAEESNNYQYIGDGVAVKKVPQKIDLSHISFKQSNKIICEGVLDELKRIGEYGTDRYTLTVVTKDVPRFRIESFCNLFEVDINGEVCRISLHFDSLPDTFNYSSKSFLNELDRVLKIENSSAYEREELCNNIQSISFVTYKVDGERDLTQYKMFDLVFESIEQTPIDYILTYRVEHWTRENLTDKYYSKEMDEKYKTNAKKDNDLNILGNNERLRKCNRCGKTISVYDGDITESTVGESLCIECLENYLLKRDENVNFNKTNNND